MGFCQKFPEPHWILTRFVQKPGNPVLLKGPEGVKGLPGLFGIPGEKGDVGFSGPWVSRSFAFLMMRVCLYEK